MSRNCIKSISFFFAKIIFKKVKYVASSLNANRKYFFIIYDTVSSTELVIISIKKAGDKKSQKLFIYPLFTYTLTITTYEYNCND